MTSAMRFIYLPYVFILLLVTVPVSAQDIKTIAVLGLDPIGIGKAESQVLSNRIRTILVNTSMFHVLERANMEAILLEQGFQQSGCTSDECIVEAGQLLGVKEMLAGSVGKFGEVYTIELRIIDIENGKIKAAATYDFRGEIENLLTEGAPAAVARVLQSYQNQTTFGKLIIRSEPAGIEVSLGGDKKGITPLVIDQIIPGSYEIILQNADYETYTNQVRIESGFTREISATLIPAFSYLKIATNVADAIINVDTLKGISGSTGLLKICPGIHRFSINHDYYLPIKEETNLIPGDTLSLQIKLEKAKGIMILAAQPENATLSISEISQQLPNSDPIELSAGEHILRLQAPYYYPLEQSVIIKRENTINLNLSLIYGGDDLSYTEKRQTWLMASTITSAAVALTSALVANHFYDKYSDAQLSGDAANYKNKTKNWDQVSKVFTTVTISASIFTIWNWIYVKNLRQELNVL